MTTVVAYVATAVVFLAIDFVWLSTVGRWYVAQLKPLLRDSPNFVYAGAFYLVYAAAVVVLAVLPAVDAQSLRTALIYGAVLGLAAYGTYDMTNLSTLRDYPVRVAVVDIVWGTVLTAVAAAAGYVAVTRLL